MPSLLAFFIDFLDQKWYNENDEYFGKNRIESPFYSR